MLSGLSPARGHLSHLAPLARARCHGDQGAALVEAAIVSPVLLFLVLGVFEYSLFSAAYLALNNVASNGARGVTISPTDALADWRALQTIERNGAALDLNRVTRVVIYHATGPTDSITNGAYANCLSGTSGSSGTGAPSYTGACNVYSVANIRDGDKANFDCTTGASRAGVSPSRWWCPTRRDATATNADYIGFYIEYDHRFLTGLFGTNRKATAEVVTRLEPQSL